MPVYRRSHCVARLRATLVLLCLGFGCGKAESARESTVSHGIRFEKLLIDLPASWSPFDLPPSSTEGGSSIRFRSGRSLVVIEVGIYAPKYSAERWMEEYFVTDARLQSVDGKEYPVKQITWMQDGTPKREYEVGVVFEIESVAYAITGVCPTSVERDRCASEILASIKVMKDTER